MKKSELKQLVVEVMTELDQPGSGEVTVEAIRALGFKPQLVEGHSAYMKGNLIVFNPKGHPQGDWYYAVKYVERGLPYLPSKFFTTMDELKVADKKINAGKVTEQKLQETIIKTPDDAVRFLNPHVSKISAGNKETETYINKLIKFAYNTGAQSARQ